MNNFISNLKNIQEKSVDKALLYVFNILEDLLLQHGFKSCDMILKDINVWDFKVEILIGILTITLNWKKHLKYRDEFFNLVKLYVNTNYSIEESEKILRGLK